MSRRVPSRRQPRVNRTMIVCSERPHPCPLGSRKRGADGRSTDCPCGRQRFENPSARRIRITEAFLLLNTEFHHAANEAEDGADNESATARGADD